jgi:hypothetical protein
MNFKYQVAGNYPITIWYRNINTGGAYSKIINDSILEIPVHKGAYVIDSIADNKCVMSTQIYFTHQIDTLKANLTNYIIDCSKEEYKIDIQVSGGTPPYKLEYLYNSILTIKNNNNFLNFSMPNGTYQFNKLSDLHQCEIVIDSSYYPQYTKLKLDSIIQNVNCELKLPTISIFPNYSTNLKLFSILNGDSSTTDLLADDLKLTLENGSFKIISITDTLGCITAINQALSLQYDTLNTMIKNVEIICADKSFQQEINTNGQAPFLLFYTQNNVLDSLLIGHNYLYSTHYNSWAFHNIKDSKGCVQPINVQETHPSFSLIDDINIIKFQDTLRIETNTGLFSYRWYIDNIINTTFHDDWIPVILYGSYQVDGRDSNNCLYHSNIFTQSIQNEYSLYPNPATTKIILTKPNSIAEIKIDLLDLLGRNVMTIISNNDLTHLNVSHLIKGTYLVRIQNTANNEFITYKLSLIE